MERAGDEVRSWFGDDEAEWRRRMDQRAARHDVDRDVARARSSDEYGWVPPRERSDRGGRGWSTERWEQPDRWREDLGRGQYDPSGAVYRGWNEPTYGYRPASGYGYASRYERERDEQWREPRREGRSRGIYEDERGRVYEFEHRSEGHFAGRGPKGYQRSDQRVHEDVCDRLTADPRIDASEIEVTVANGEVTLSGTVHSRDEKRRTEDVIERIPGVSDVHNNLRVRRWQDAVPS